jgi:hypothetical protein
MKKNIDQFNQLATKEDLNDLKEELVSKTEFRQMLNALDGIAKDVKDIKCEHTVNIAAHDRFEKRITKVEKKVRIAAI